MWWALFFSNVTDEGGGAVTPLLEPAMNIQMLNSSLVSLNNRRDASNVRATAPHGIGAQRLGPMLNAGVPLAIGNVVTVCAGALKALAILLFISAACLWLTLKVFCLFLPRRACRRRR